MLFSKLGVDAKIVDLDQLEDGETVYQGLKDLTGKQTVPQVFIGGEFIGGCDDTLAAHSSGRLTRLLGSVGISIS